MAIELLTVERSQIEIGERHREDYGDINDLAESMKQEGIIQPLAVKRNGERFKLLAGGRRIKAAEKAGITEIPVRVYPENLSETQMLMIELCENVFRKDMTWLEQTRLRKKIHDLGIEIHGRKVSKAPDAKGWTQEQTATMTGVNQRMISAELQLAEAVEAFPQLAQAKTRDEAVKMMKKMGETMIRQELAKRIEEHKAQTPFDKQLAQIAQRFIVADFFDMVKQLPDKSIDFCEVDPPYAIDLMELKKKRDISMYNEESYNEVEKEDYLFFLERTINECYRVMSDQSWMVFWFAIEPWIEDIYMLLSKAGFQTRRLVGLWVKETGQTMNPALHLANAYEPFFYCRKGNPSIMKQGRTNVFNYKAVAPGKKRHPTERPIELIQELLQTFCLEGSRVLVPFLGSGNTILAAANLNLIAFGADLSQEYKDAFTVRVYSGKPGEYRSY